MFGAVCPYQSTTNEKRKEGSTKRRGKGRKKDEGRVLKFSPVRRFLKSVNVCAGAYSFFLR